MNRGILYSRLLTFLFWIAMSALTLLPVWWMFLVSVRTRADLFGKPSFLLDVQAMTWENYAAVLSNPTFQKYMTNSLIVATSNAVLVSVLALLAAYAMSRFALVGKDNLFFWVLTNRMAPPAVFL
ncbi:MAG: carbohydrate ABC transporter permease, partial [Rhodobacterales bacterium]|nr:carbohydrate ABC transporter permease [Rhodobacterales bacterium]